MKGQSPVTLRNPLLTNGMVAERILLVAAKNKNAVSILFEKERDMSAPHPRFCIVRVPKHHDVSFLRRAGLPRHRPKTARHGAAGAEVAHACQAPIHTGGAPGGHVT